MTAPMRPCLACGQYDDDPRHVTATPDGALLAYHMDCCAMARDCRVCQAQLEGAPPAARGDELRSYLLTTGPGSDRPGWTVTDLGEKEV